MIRVLFGSKQIVIDQEGVFKIKSRIYVLVVVDDGEDDGVIGEDECNTTW